MQITVTFHPLPRLDPLVDGAVTADGIDLTWDFDAPGPMFHRLLSQNTGQLFEFSLADFMITRQRPEWAHLDWVGIPIFLARPIGLLRNFHVNVHTGIDTLADFRARRIGVPDYGMTAAVWARIILRTLYGIENREITWYNGRPPGQRHGRLLEIDNSPGGVTLVNCEEGQTLTDLLERGEIDAAYGDQSMGVHATSNVRPLFDSTTYHQVFVDLFARTGVLPVNHILLAQRSLLAENPGLARTIYDLFERSKQEAYARARRASEGYLLFPDIAFNRQSAEFGADPYPSGLAANRHTLELLGEQLLRDGLISRPPIIDALIAEDLRLT